MTALKLIYLFLSNLPQLVTLVHAIQTAIEDAKKAQAEETTKRKVKDDLAAISEAFKTKDAKKLKDIFNS